MQPGPNPTQPDQDHAALRDVIEFLDQGVALFDAEANLSLVNASFLSMYPNLLDVLKPGLPWTIFLREAVGRGAIPKPVGHRLDAIEAGLLDDPSQSQSVQIPMGRGQVFTLKLGASADGGFMLTQTATADPTSNTDAAREAETLLRKVLEACPSCLTMSRVTDGQIIYRSPAATDLLGSAKSSFNHFAHREERADFVTLLLPDARVDNMRVTCLRPKGDAFAAEISARLIDYRGEDVIVATIEDLTDELAVKAEMDRQKEQLFQSEKLSALGELLAGVAHELNNPLSIIVGNADILQEELENSGLEKRIDKLSQAAHRCVRIVRSFLSLARQEPLNLRPLDPVKLIETSVDAVVADADAANVTLAIVPMQNAPSIVADEVQLTQVIINLLTNAIHAIQGVGQGNAITVDCKLIGNSQTLRISVKDNGPGIPDDLKTRIFDPLFTTKDVGKGTGVGLAYCLRIVAAHKGQISVDSTLGQGATFTIDLPLAAA